MAYSVQEDTAPGVPVINAFAEVGGLTRFTVASLVEFFKNPLSYPEEILRHFWIVVRYVAPSLIYLTLTMTFVLSLAGYDFFTRVGASQGFGFLAAFVIFRFLGPFLTGIIMNSSWCTVATAEVANMKVNEELDALVVMGIDPMKYVMVPRIIAAAAGGFFLSLVAMITALLGVILGAMKSYESLASLFDWIRSLINMSDVWASLITGMVLTCLQAAASCRQGLLAGHGSEGVKNAVKQAVVTNLYITYTVALVSTTILKALVWQSALLDM